MTMDNNTEQLQKEYDDLVLDIAQKWTQEKAKRLSELSRLMSGDGCGEQ